MKQEQRNFWEVGACTHLLRKIGADMCILSSNAPSITYCGAIVPCRQRQSLCNIPFAVFAHGAFPAEMHHAQKLQKSFRSPKATLLKDHPAQLNESIAPTV